MPQRNFYMSSIARMKYVRKFIIIIMKAVKDNILSQSLTGMMYSLNTVHILLTVRKLRFVKSD
jgi:hypothetical protein